MCGHCNVFTISRLSRNTQITFLPSKQLLLHGLVLSLSAIAFPGVGHTEISAHLAQPSHSEVVRKDGVSEKDVQESVMLDLESKDLLDQLELLHKEMQTLRASLEQQEHRIEKLEQRLAEGSEKYSVAKPPLSEAAAYEKLQKKLKGTFSAEVEQAVEDFIAQYPNAPQLPDLHFYVGQQYMQQGKDKRALQHLAVIVTQYPHYRRHPEALLSMGILFKRLGEIQEARFSFQRLLKQYPETPFAKQATEQLSSLKP